MKLTVPASIRDLAALMKTTFNFDDEPQRGHNEVSDEAVPIGHPTTKFYANLLSNFPELGFLLRRARMMLMFELSEFNGKIAAPSHPRVNRNAP
jgi:hypothetical protein